MEQKEKINLAAALSGSEHWIGYQQYEELKRKKNPTWTDCQSEQEWLVKLHYLRSLLKEKRIEKENFVKKEQRLILKWWTKFCMQRI
jgi:hypothetical protein